VLVALSFIAIAAWTLIPDKVDENESARGANRNVLLATMISYFLAEIGDKTQIATIALGAQFRDVAMVTLGTTLGMMLANVPAVFLGDRIVRVVPLKVVRGIAAALFLAIGLWVLWDAAGG